MSETIGGSGDRTRVLTICGGGNAGHALAVVVSKHATAHIDWLVSSAERADLLRRGLSRGGLRSTGVITAEADRLRAISSDPAEVIPHADMVLRAVPAFAHATVLSSIRMHVGEATYVGQPGPVHPSRPYVRAFSVVEGRAVRRSLNSHVLRSCDRRDGRDRRTPV